MIRFLALRLRERGFLSIVGSITHYCLHLPSFGLDRLVKLGKHEIMPLFNKVVLQTQSECNYTCSFCPGNKVERPHGIMSWETFKKVIDELGRLSFSGTIYPNMQEPLLDPRIIEMCEYMNYHSPFSRTTIQTNGSLLTEETTQKLCKIPNLHIIIDDYTLGLIVTKRIKGYILTKEEWKKIICLDRSSLQTLTNRAGSIGKPKHLNNFCVLPFTEIYVAYDGKLLLCAADWTHEQLMGDINKNSLSEIWNNDLYKYFRRNLLRYDRFEICSKCDYWGVE